MLLDMNFANAIKIGALVWAAAILLVAFVATIPSPAPWLVVSIVAFGPWLVLLHLYRELPQTTSQCIPEARR